MDSGLARHRRRFRVYPIVMPVSFLMWEDQYAIYTEFVENELNGWSAYFKLTIRDGQGIRQARVRFTQAPNEVLVSPVGLWRVSGEIEKLNID